MSNKTQLSNNNTKLASLIQELQGKAAGSGGASIDTCNLTITYSDGAYVEVVVATVLRNGLVTTIVPTSHEAKETVILNDVVCGTSVFVLSGGLSLYGYSIGGGAAREFSESGFLRPSEVLIKMPTEAGASATVNIYNND